MDIIEKNTEGQELQPQTAAEREWAEAAWEAKAERAAKAADNGAEGAAVQGEQNGPDERDGEQEAGGVEQGDEQARQGEQAGAEQHVGGAQVQEGHATAQRGPVAAQREYAQLEAEKEQAVRTAREAEEALRIFFEGQDVPALVANARELVAGKAPQEEMALRRWQATAAQALLERQANELTTQRAELQMQRDLMEIQRLNPNVKEIGELGSAYFKLIEAGVDAVTAYNVTLVGSRQAEGRQAGKEHLVATGGGAPRADMAEIPKEELVFYQEHFPKDSPKKLRERYNRIQERQKQAQ